MECLVELEVVGRKMLVYGDRREIITIEVEDEKIKMRKVSLLRKELTVEVKVIETMTGLQSKHEIYGLEEKIEGEDYTIVKQKQVQGVGENQMLNLYAIKGKDWQVGMEVQGEREIRYSTRIIGGDVCECT